MVISQLHARLITPKCDRSNNAVIAAVLVIIAITFVLLLLRFVNTPKRNTPSVAPPVIENILKANQRIFSTGAQASAINARIMPKPIMPNLDMNK